MFRFAMVGVALILLASCSRDDPGAPEVPDIPRTDVWVANFSAESILEIYLRPTGTEGWGASWIDRPIPGGVLYTHIGEVVSGTFDVLMVGQITTQETLGMELVGNEIGLAFNATPRPGQRVAGAQALPTEDGTALDDDRHDIDLPLLRVSPGPTSA